MIFYDQTDASSGQVNQATQGFQLYKDEPVDSKSTIWWDKLFNYK